MTYDNLTPDAQAKARRYIADRMDLPLTQEIEEALAECGHDRAVFEEHYPHMLANLAADQDWNADGTPCLTPYERFIWEMEKIRTNDDVLASYVSDRLTDIVEQHEDEDITREQVEAYLEDIIESMTSWDYLKPVYRAVERAFEK